MTSAVKTGLSISAVFLCHCFKGDDPSVSPDLCPWPGWSRHQVLEFRASGSVPPLLEISQVHCSLGRNA